MTNSFLNNAIIYEATLFSHHGRKQDISTVFNGITIYESIHQYYLRGFINLTNTGDFLKNFPIVGGETLRIVFGDNKTQVSRWVDFVITGIDSQPNATDETNRNFYYTLKLLSHVGLDAYKFRFSRRFDNTPTWILQEIMPLIQTHSTSGFKTINTRGSYSNMDFVSNFWNAHELIHYLCHENADSVFFETIDQFHFDKISTLLKQAPSEELISSTSLETHIQPNAVQLKAFNEYFDIEQTYLNGGFGRLAYSLIPESYNHQIHAELLSNFLDKYPKLGMNQQLSKSLSTPFNDVNVTFDDPRDRIERRLALETIKNYQLVVKLYGVATRNVGKIILYNLPPSDGQIANENFSGKWLITEIRHDIGADRVYKQNVKIVKNAFFNNFRVER